ncbi:MAG: aldose 1-epimerase [Phaeodactylibacter sp.]|uniref:aldose 1-epimerase n=1 Tax=Phaeodactylibacter sp. TaxID=1940289 RepID=UPI0032EF93A5
MFYIKTEAFGDYEAYLLSDPTGAHQLKLVPAFGACVIDLRLHGQTVLDTYQTPKEMSINRWAKNVLLYPFPNRLKHGQYEWEGQRYEFPVNDVPTNNALHGFGTEQTMEVAAKEASVEHAQIRCRFSYDGQLDYYPFPFRFEVAFTLRSGALEIGLSVENTGKTALPFGMGWHPYFRISDDLGNHHLHLPPCEMVGVDAEMIPTGKRYEYTTFSQPRRIGMEVLDNCFALQQQEGRVQIQLSYADQQLGYWQEVGESGFSFVQLFTPPHRTCLAIEPMTCNIDAFNNGEGLMRVEPGEQRTATFGVQVGA